MDRNIDIAEQRKRAGMTQAEFSVFTGIPVGTLRNWEQGKRKAPPYINTLVYEALRRNTMINIETVSFIAKLNEYFTCFIAGDIESSERVRLGCGTRSEPEIV